MGMTLPRHRLETDSVTVIDCASNGAEELHIQIVTVARECGYVIPGPDVAAIMWDFEAGIRWAAVPALKYLDDLLEDHEYLTVENNCLVIRQTVTRQIAN